MPSPGLRFKACQRGGKKLRLAEFTDKLHEADWCGKEHIGYVLEGSLSVDFSGGVPEEFRTGDGIFIPEGTAHKAHIAPGGRALVIFTERA
jgi:quercetin dioxygenase-like cupin family protein